MKGEYELSILHTPEALEVRITLFQDGCKKFIGTLRGNGVPLSITSLLKTFIKHPIALWLTMTRIMWQAYHLHLRKKIVAVPKVALGTAPLISSSPSIFDRLRLRILKFSLKREQLTKLPK